MARTLLDLANQMDELRKKVAVSASQAAIKVAQTIVADLAYRTPVDTSQALSNWIVTIGSANVGKIDPHYPGEFGSTRNASAQRTILNSKDVLLTKKPGQAIYITNNLPYIQRLNEGYSGQAPYNFVGLSIMVGTRTVKNFKLG